MNGSILLKRVKKKAIIQEARKREREEKRKWNGRVGRRFEGGPGSQRGGWKVFIVISPTSDISTPQSREIHPISPGLYQHFAIFKLREGNLRNSYTSSMKAQTFFFHKGEEKKKENYESKTGIWKIFIFILWVAGQNSPSPSSVALFLDGVRKSFNKKKGWCTKSINGLSTIFLSSSPRKL